MNDNFRNDFVEFLKNPSEDNYMSLRYFLLSSNEFNPYSDELETMYDFLGEEKYNEVIQLIKKHLWPNYILSPGVHLRYSFALDQVGKKEESEMEQLIAYSLIDALELTGDGSEKSPYCVLRISDEYDILSYKELSFKSQVLVEQSGKHFDIISVKEHDDKIWFDITDIRNRIGAGS